jgi:hypothetical protein
MNDIQRMAAETAVRNMLKKGWVDICAIRKILEMTGGIPQREDMQVLELLHCVSFGELQPDLLRGLPLILQRVLGAESLQFEFQEPTRRLMLVKG